MYKVHLLIAVCLIAGYTSNVPAEVASSNRYNFVYAEAAPGGKTAESSSYKTNALIITSGPSVVPAASTKYAIAPANGKSLATTAKVQDWQLY